MLQLFHMGWLNIVNFKYFDFQTAHQSGYFFIFLKPQLAGNTQSVKEKLKRHHLYHNSAHKNDSTQNPTYI